MPTKTRKEVEETEIFPEPLKMADRCDATASGSEQAFVIFVKEGKPSLMLCSHHANEHEPILMASGWTIHEDARIKINIKPSPSTNTEAPVMEAD